MKDNDQLTAEEQAAAAAAEANTAENSTESGQDGKVAELTKQVAELNDKYLRMFAEFDNYKKRTVREKLDLMKTAAQDTMSALLPVVDDFDRAKNNIDQNKGIEHPSLEGVVLVYNKLQNVLRQLGLEPVSSTGEGFDPEMHEAVTEIPAPTEDLRGKVVDTIEKGYYLNGKLIRHAKVVVGK